MVNFKKLNSPENKRRMKEIREKELIEQEKTNKEIKTQRFMITKLNKCSYDDLSDWEKNFLNSIKIQLNRYEGGIGKPLSQKQKDILERIFEEK